MFKALLPERLCLLGRDFGMISFKKRQDSPQSPQDNNGLPRVMRTLLCAVWTKGKKKTGRGARQGPKGGAKPQQSGGGKKRDMSQVR